MKPYAEIQPRRALQMTGDLLLLLWVLLWTWLGVAVHATVVTLGDVGEDVEARGVRISGQLGNAGDRAAAVPGVGDSLRAPFDQAAAAAGALADVGRAQQDAVTMVALPLGLATALVPVAVVVALWVPRRVRFARRASAARTRLDTSDDLELFALRAIAAQPMHRLAGVSEDPVGAWRRGDAGVVRRLAELELHDLGLRGLSRRR